MRALSAVFLACVASAELCIPARSVAQSSGGAILSGRVVDASDRPIADATVSIEGIIATTTDSTGGFAFAGLETETLLLRVQHAGYATATRTILFSADTSQDVEIRLVLRAALLAGVTVLDSADTDPRGYAKRRQNGEGFFLTRDEIRKRGRTPRVENLLGTIPGLKVDKGVVKVARGRISILGNDCEDGVQYVVDGAMIGPAFTPRNIAPETLTGVEVYKTASATPAEYRSVKVACGTVVLWTY